MQNISNTNEKTASVTINSDTAELRDIKEISMRLRRGSYNEILISLLPTSTQEAVQALISKAGSAEKVDEHGSWDFGVDSTKKGECSALNWDLYGIGNDYLTGNLLIVIQVRSFYRKKEGYWPQIRKNYFLLGTNEDDTVFAHSVTPAVIHAAIRKERDVVKSVQDWIFDGDYSGMIRQGDLALIPCTRRPSAPKIANRVLTLQGSHRLKANVIRQNGTVYAKNPHLVHIPGTHPEIQGENRWYKVMVGKRASFWKFAAPTVD